MSVKEALAKTVDTMKRWQKIENAAVSQTAKIMEETDHPLIRTVMEIINQDSQMHYRVQQLIRDSLETKAVNIDYDELAKVWKAVERHIEIERQTIALATEALETLAGTKNPVQIYFLEYLKQDEEKHDRLLDNLNKIKLKMYP